MAASACQALSALSNYNETASRASQTSTEPNLPLYAPQRTSKHISSIWQGKSCTIPPPNDSMLVASPEQASFEKLLYIHYHSIHTADPHACLTASSTAKTACHTTNDSSRNMTA